MSHPIYQAIAATLLNSAGLIAIVPAGRIVADQLPDDPVLPAIRYALLTDSPAQRFASADSGTAELQIDLYAHRSAEAIAQAWTIDGLVRLALDRKTITPAITGYPFADVRAMCVQRGVPLAEPPYYRIRSIYRLFASRSS